MKLFIDINSTRVVMDMDTADALVKLLEKADHYEHRWMGKTTGISSNSYVDMITPLDITDKIKFSAMTDSQYDALKLVAKLLAEKETKES